MKTADVINCAYGSIPKEATLYIDLDVIPTWRGLKYYWYKLVRKITR